MVCVRAAIQTSIKFKEEIIKRRLIVQESIKRNGFDANWDEF